MTTAADVLRIAAAEVGTKESPIGSNRQKYGAEYGWNGVFWCAIFDWWVFNHAGFPLPIKTASCSVLLADFKARNQFHTRPQPGDVFFCGKAGEAHTGLVESVDADGLGFTTIEGNSDPQGGFNGIAVCRHHRRVGDGRVFGFGRPAYSGAPGPAPVTQIEIGDIGLAAQLNFSIKLGGDGKGYTDIDVPVDKIIGAPVLNASDPGPGGQGYPFGVVLSRLAIGTKTRVVAVGGPANATVGVTATRLT